MTRRDSLILLSGAATSLSAASRFRLEPGRDSVRVTRDDREITAFHYAADFDRPFVHPLVTPSGIVLSRAVPPAPGEADDHAWHRGLWYAHGDISGADFWREKKDKTGRKTTGRMEVRQAPAIDGNALTAVCDLVTAEGKRIGHCIERFRFDQIGPSFLIDVRITLVADGGIDLVMGDSDDGGLAVRLTSEFEEEKGATLTNSEGRTGTEQMWGKPALWTDYSGRKSGKPCGVAMLDHPGNFRYPTQWHARGYGLNSANPFAAGSFMRTGKGDKTKRTDGVHTIPKGSELAFRYRVVLHDGDAAPAGLDKLHRDFAKSGATL